MREILFKGKTTDTKEWIEGYYCPCCFGYFPCLPAIIAKDKMESGCWNPQEVYPETVRQFTGLCDSTKWEVLTTDEQANFLYPENGEKRSKKDWKGKKIFEGDLLRWNDRIVQVVWLESNAQFDCNFVCYANDKSVKNFKGIEPRNWHECEIVGNANDNPELLKGDEGK